MLMRHDSETFHAVLKRLDNAIAKVMDGGDAVDEINCCGKPHGDVKVGAANR
jgi:hypothetical protein